MLPFNYFGCIPLIESFKNKLGYAIENKYFIHCLSILTRSVISEKFYFVVYRVFDLTTLYIYIICINIYIY